MEGDGLSVSMRKNFRTRSQRAYWRPKSVAGAVTQFALSGLLTLLLLRVLARGRATPA